MSQIEPHITREVSRDAYLQQRRNYYATHPDALGGKVREMHMRLMVKFRTSWANAFKEENKWTG